MAYPFSCCCAPHHECVPTGEGCSEASSGVTGGICAGEDTMMTSWEMEISGLLVNDDYCEHSATCSTCYTPKGSGIGGGPNTCHRPSVNGRNDCYSQPLDNLNGLYLVSVGMGGGCCVDDRIYEFTGEYNQCASCLPPTCPFSDEFFLMFMLDFQDRSGVTAWPGPVGAKLMLWNSIFSLDGCRQSDSRKAQYYAANDTFRSHNDTFECADRNVFENEITSGDPIEIAAGTYAGDIVVPMYYGGEITMRPIC